MSDETENKEGELVQQLRAKLDNLGVKYHHSHNAESLEKLLADAESTDDDKAPQDRSAPPPEPEPVKDDPITAGLIACEVTKWGHGKIHTGKPDKPFFERGDIVHVPEATALSYESKYFAQIVDD